MGNKEVERIRCKRRLGIYFALFSMVLMSRESWGASPTHPPLQLRVNNIVSILGGDRNDQDFIVACAAFSMLQSCMPGALGVNWEGSLGSILTATPRPHMRCFHGKDRILLASESRRPRRDRRLTFLGPERMPSSISREPRRTPDQPHDATLAAADYCQCR